MSPRLIPAALCAALMLFAMPVQAAPEALIRAIVHVESRGNPNATGRHGEIGLMQIRCATARGIGYRGSCRALYQPAINLRWGGAYLDRAWRMAHGNACHAATLYNRGLAARPGPSAYCRKVLEAMR